MTSAVIIFLLFWLFGFIAMFAVYSPLTNKYLQTLDFKVYMLPFPYILLFAAIGGIGGYLVAGNRDFIEPLNMLRLCLPLILAGAIYLMSLVEGGKWLFSAMVACCVAAAVYIQPLGGGNPFVQLPEIYFRTLLILFGTLFCLFYYIMNSTLQALIIPSAMTLFGLCILSGLGAAPLWTALSSAVLLGALLAYLSINFHGAKIDMDNGACTALAFLIFNLLIIHIGEYSFPSCLIFSSVFWAELIFAVWHKFTITRAGSLQENTNYYLAGTKYSFHVLALNILKICTVNLFLGWFQLFSSNQYSLFIISLAIVLWLNCALGKQENEPQTLKEINHEFVKDLKQNIAEAKEILTQTRQKDKK